MRIPFFTLLLAVLSFTTIRSNAAGGSSEKLKKAVVQSGIPESSLSLYIANDEGKVLLNVNEKKLMNPASLTKIVTAGTVLKNLSPDMKWFTQLLSSASIENQILQGNLCLKGGGDPAFVSEKMWFLVNVFIRNQIKKISGDLIVDNSRFDKQKIDKGRDSVRVDRAYDAPVDALSMNWNSVNVFVRPNEKSGQPAIVFADPENDYIRVVNKSKTSSSGSPSIQVSRESQEDHDTIIVTGSIPVQNTEIVFYKNVSSPELWTASNLKSFLSQRGVTISGKIRTGKCESNSKVLAEVDSKPLHHILSDMLKFSNNFVAEMLVKNLAAEKGILPATMEQGLQIENEYLLSLGFSKDEFELENASGLTHKNHLSSLLLFKILQKLKTDFLVFPEFLSGLPIGGVDGTLKHRMKGNSKAIQIRAKTGFLTGVVGLAGYVGQNHDAPLSFAFLFNGSESYDGKAKSLFDRLSELMVEMK